VEATAGAPLPARPAERPRFALRAALARRNGFPLICEVKRASPSAGVLRADLDVASQARTYAAGGAAAVSVLTEPSRFLGSLDDLAKVRAAVTVPILRKDFVVHPRMVDEACAYGADAVLLIAAALPPGVLLACAARADALGLDCLLELIYPRDLASLSLREWPIVGVNARDLETLEMRPGRFAELAAAATAEGRVLVAESGLATLEDVRAVRAAGAGAALVGEALVRSSDPGALVRAWSGS
jgi:indole-3-glycerol phosphate synthase